MAISVAEPNREKLYQFKIGKIIWASSAGTLIEWYDFYIFGSLATLMAVKFFPPGNPVIAFLQTLAVFATGFAVRPFGALFFGHIGDLIGRKYAFMVTITIMGLSTFLIGIMPTYSHIGFWAPLILVVLRLLQGLALGGEYGGAAVYVAEHSPDSQRGYYTSYIQTTATVGFFVSLLIVLGTRLGMGEAAFAAWGWRIPFLLSIVLVAMSLYIRWSLRETPLFRRLKESGKASAQPLRDTGRNWKLILLALLGATAGQAVVWYTGQFYAFYFLQTVCKVPAVTANIIAAIALVLGTPFFLVFGWLSDRIGRKKIMMAGNLIAAITYIPIYMAMKAYSSPMNVPALTILMFIQVIYVTMVYGPIAAYLVELFPAKIRYTSLSVPYHIGNGWFGGFTPLIASSLVAATGNIYMGLAFPIAVALMTFVVGGLYLKETAHVRIWDEVEVPAKVATAETAA
ncbi:MAG TPA: MFS transporter [Candidatus Baltobacteraceae bacterium]|nr:MFS transporter [Candidatus Baltobacteraceae bacterium]